MNWRNPNDIFKKMVSINDADSSNYDELLDEYITAEGLDHLQENKLIPTAFREKQKEEIRAQAEPQELMEYLNLAIHTLVNEGLNGVDSDTYKAMVDQFLGAKLYLDKFDYTCPMEENFRMLLKFTDLTMETIFKIAQYEYSQHRQKESLAIFALLSVLEPEDPDYWYRLGVVAHQLQTYELAIKALKNAVTLNANFIEARIFLADGYTKLLEIENAKLELKQIEECSYSIPLQTHWQEMIQQIKY